VGDLWGMADSLQPALETGGRPAYLGSRGLPIDGACIYLVRDQDGPRSIESSVQWTDAEGRFAWDAVDGEDLKIAVQVQSYAEPKHYPFKGSQSGEQTLVAGRAACADSGHPRRSQCFGFDAYQFHRCPKAIPPAMKRLVEAGSIRTKGERRGMQYSAA